MEDKFKGTNFQFDTYSFEAIKSHAGVRSDLFPRSLKETLVTDFFGGVAQVGMVRPSNATDGDSTNGDVESDPEPQINPHSPAVKGYEAVAQITRPDDRETGWHKARLWIASLLLIGGFALGVSLT